MHAIWVRLHLMYHAPFTTSTSIETQSSTSDAVLIVLQCTLTVFVTHFFSSLAVIGAFSSKDTIKSSPLTSTFVFHFHLAMLIHHSEASIVFVWGLAWKEGIGVRKGTESPHMSNGKVWALIFTPPSARTLGEVCVGAIGSGNSQLLVLTFVISSRHSSSPESPIYN